MRLKGGWGSGQSAQQQMAKLSLTPVCMALPLSAQNMGWCQSNWKKTQEEMTTEQKYYSNAQQTCRYEKKNPHNNPLFHVH